MNKTESIGGHPDFFSSLLERMKEFFDRLRKRPGLTTELLVVSLVANILALASPLFVMLVLSRYVSYGIDATLLTLVSGVIIAVVLELGFRQLRLRLAKGLGSGADENMAVGAYGMLVHSQMDALDQVPLPERQQLMRNLDTVSSAYNATNLCAILDVPFAILFLGVLYLLNPVLGIITTLFIVVAFALRLLSRKTLQPYVQRFEDANAVGAGLLSTANRSPDTVRTFDPAGSIMNSWTGFAATVTAARASLVQKQGQSEAFMMSMQALLGVTIIAVGATYVVAGELDIGALIGANILSARALAPIVRLAQLTGVLNRGAEALARLRVFATLATEDGERIPSAKCRGALEFRDLSFTQPGMPAPLFESLNLTLETNSLLLVKGANGAGKTTLMRLILGLLDPDRGQILLDGTDLRQLSPQWWRLQVAYMPQEPFFFDDTIRSNLQYANPDIDEKQLLAAIEEAGLTQYIEESMQGLETRLDAGGANLALGIRKRLALARALVRVGPVAVLDEPTEGLDTEGRMRIYAAMNRLTRAGCTIIVASDDPEITKGARIVLDLDKKPVPGITMARRSRSAPARAT